MRILSHAAVADSGRNKTLRGENLSGLINAVLRNYLRNQEELDQFAVSHNAGKYGHPNWILKCCKRATQNNGKDRRSEQQQSSNVVACEPPASYL